MKARRARREGDSHPGSESWLESGPWTGVRRCSWRTHGRRRAARWLVSTRRVRGQPWPLSSCRLSSSAPLSRRLVRTDLMHASLLVPGHAAQDPCTATLSAPPGLRARAALPRSCGPLRRRSRGPRLHQARAPRGESDVHLGTGPKRSTATGGAARGAPVEPQPSGEHLAGSFPRLPPRRLRSPAPLLLLQTTHLVHRTMAPSTLLRLSALAALSSVAFAASGDVNTAVTVRPLLSSHRQRDRTTADSSRGYQADGERIIAGYVPSIALAVVGIVLYGASTLALWVQWFRTGRKLYMLTLNISMACASPVCLAAGTSRLTCCARPTPQASPWASSSESSTTTTWRHSVPTLRCTCLCSCR